MNFIYISSCILLKNNKILISSRPEGKILSGFWELPGGKCFVNESFENCAVRELNEEIGANVNMKHLYNLDIITHRYKNKFIIMMVYMLSRWSGVLKPKENQQLIWVNRSEIKHFKFLPGSKILFNRIYENYYKFFK
jgi:8-oxo-dGTP diphosphatase